MDQKVIMSKLVMSIAIAAFGVLVYSIWFGDAEKQSTSDELIAETESTVSRPEQPTSRTNVGDDLQPSSSSSDGGDSESLAVPPVVNEKARDYLQRLSNSGYFGSEELQLYAAYEISDLEELSHSGDLLASYALYDRHLKNGDLELALDAAYAGVVHGSTRNIGLIASSYVSRAITLRDSDSMESTADRELLTAIAWYEVARMRGDKDLSRLGRDVAAREGINLDSNALKAIRIAAQELYDDLEKEREALGLNPFDNTAFEQGEIFAISED